MDDPRNRYAPQGRGAEGADLGQAQHTDNSTARQFGPVERFELLANLSLDPNSSRAAIAMMAVILVRLHSATGTMFGSLTSLAADAKVSRRHAARGIRELCDAGWIGRKSGNSGGQANVYWMGEPATNRVEELVRLGGRVPKPSLVTASTLGTESASPSARNGRRVVSKMAPQPCSFNSSPKPPARTRRLSAVERVMANVQAAQARRQEGFNDDFKVGDNFGFNDDFNVGDAIEGEFTREGAPPQRQRQDSQQGQHGSVLTDKQLDALAWINQQVHFGAITEEEGKRQRAVLMQHSGGGHGQQ